MSNLATKISFTEPFINRFSVDLSQNNYATHSPAQLCDVFSLLFLDRKIYSTSGGEVLFTKMDQEAEMDIKVLYLFTFFIFFIVKSLSYARL